MNKKTVIKSIQNQILKIKQLRHSTQFSAEHTKWLMDTIYLLEGIFGKNSRIYLNFVNLSWQPSGSFVANVDSMEQVLDKKRKDAYVFTLESARGLLESGIEQIKLKGIKDAYEGKNPITDFQGHLKVKDAIRDVYALVIKS